MTAELSIIEAGDSHQLPDEFTIEVSDFAIMRSGISPREFAGQWADVRKELIRRGYQVTEWYCNETMQRKARCLLMPSPTQAQEP